MEGLVGLHNRSVLLTGHTGFKGSWLSLWLASLGAQVHGYALEPPTDPNLFEVAAVGDLLASDTRADVANLAALSEAVDRAQPEIVFHLAAQPLVREGYRDPIGTLTTNVMGTANLLEAVRQADSVRAVVVIATDKVYDNPDQGRAFTEDDALGGHDPYSASKAATEIVVAAYRPSFFGELGHPAHVASARAGNVIGGGDWASDRLVPDCLRAFANGERVRLRHPEAIRPWQHVLDPLAGYLALGIRLLGPDGARFARAWNFGPNATDEASVEQVARMIADRWGDDAGLDRSVDSGPPEAERLRLDSSRARSELGWSPAWSLDQSVDHTVAWHRAWTRQEDMRAVTEAQIESRTRAALT